MLKVAALSLLTVSGFLSASAANALTLTSPDIKPGGKIADEQVFNGWDCTGKNVSPALAWTGAPKGTKSFAVSAYDPDAPTGSGFWHWWVANLPADAAGLPKGAGGGTGLPEGAVQPNNDYSLPGMAALARPRASRITTTSQSMLSTSTSFLSTPRPRLRCSVSTPTRTRWPRRR
jgi:phosphatidylethanolamine-binding protein (PEBP) family uncharacterized protein